MPVQEQQSLGARLQALRLGRRLQQRKVAAAADMDASVLSKIESGKLRPTEEQCAALAKFFGVPEPELAALRLREIFAEHRKSPGFREAVLHVAEEAGVYPAKPEIKGKS